MALLILGLVLFLGVHSTRIFADGWRGSMIARLGPWPWKGLYSVASILGFVVLVIGFRMARRDTLGVCLQARRAAPQLTARIGLGVVIWSFLKMSASSGPLVVA